jgi:hypothetical protein
MQSYRDSHERVIIYLSSNDLDIFRDGKGISGILVDNTNKKKNRLEINLSDENVVSVDKILVDDENGVRVNLKRGICNRFKGYKRFAYESSQGRNFIHIFDVKELRGDELGAYKLRFSNNANQQ